MEIARFRDMRSHKVSICRKASSKALYRVCMYHIHCIHIHVSVYMYPHIYIQHYILRVDRRQNTLLCVKVSYFEHAKALLSDYAEAGFVDRMCSIHTSIFGRCHWGLGVEMHAHSACCDWWKALVVVYLSMLVMWMCVLHMNVRAAYECACCIWMCVACFICVN